MMTKKIFSFFAFLLIAGLVHTQTYYDDYIGAGHDDNVTFSSSPVVEDSHLGNTINGHGLQAERMAASRFLAQASMGGTLEDIDHVLDIGFEAWIDEQMELPQSQYLDQMTAIWDVIYNAYIGIGFNPDEIYGPWALTFNYAWWTNTIKNDDQLRQRIAYALSQILVISINSDLQDHGEGLSSFYDILMKHSFGNYRDLLLEVTLNPNMGYYLSHFNNPRAIPEENIHPDENYAREIMQLFTIGLYELNNDGSRKLDAEGNFIPTYNNDDIKEFAKVFTGLGPGGIEEWIDWTNEPYFGLGFYGTDRTVQMEMYDEFHEPGPKTLLNGYTIPADQDPIKDIEDAIDHLFNHPNVGPFISRQLIQRLVKSNPSAGYIERVANVFNNDQNGERGNLGSVIRAILLDVEARSCDWFLDESNGKMKEPVLRFSNFNRAIELDIPSGNYWVNGFSFLEDTEQMTLAAPTVFNFYLPDHQPVGGLSDNDMLAPEFNLHNTRTAIGYINQVNQWIVWGAPWWTWEDEIGEVTPGVVFEPYADMAMQPEEMINFLDIVFTHGQMTDDTRNIIRQAIEPLQWDEPDVYMYKFMLAGYLTLISPDFVIFK